MWRVIAQTLLDEYIDYRWKRTPDSSIMTDETGKRVLEFVAIQRRDNSQWAIPGVRYSL